MIIIHEVDLGYPDERRFHVYHLPRCYGPGEVLDLCRAPHSALKAIPKMEDVHPDNNLVVMAFSVSKLPNTWIWEITASYGMM